MAQLVAGLLMGGGAAWLGAGAVFWLLGAALGFVLFQASFGFAGAFRRLLAEGRGAGLRAQMLLLAVATVVMLPAIEAGSLAGAPVRGFVFPVGVALLVGAFLFGIGMQIGGGCASGTLYTAAGGQGARMWITLAAFVAGATLAAWQYEAWADWPGIGAVSLPGALGLWPAVGLSLAAFALVFGLSRLIEQARHGAVEPMGWQARAPFPAVLWRGPWPMAWGAVGLALLSALTLFLAGRPWAITAAFPLWGSKLVEALGWDDPAFWAFWEDPTRTEALLRPLLADRTTVMDLGLMAGAFLAAALAGRASGWRWPRVGEAAASIIGGLLLGVGAVLASGCNISAYLGGIASGSLHGWVWIVPALLGNAVGLRLRPLFGLGRA